MWRKTNCIDCGEKLYKMKSDFFFDLCEMHSYDTSLPWGIEGANLILYEWKNYEEHLDDYTWYYDFTNIAEWMYWDAPEWLCAWFIKFKAIICIVLGLHGCPTKFSDRDGVYLDFWGSMSGYYEQEWMEKGYEVGKGFFSNWWITEI